jgi:hypothetical protein
MSGTTSETDTPRRRRGRAQRQPLMPDAAANPAAATPHRARTNPHPARLYEGHLSAECSIRHNGAPACPACLLRQLRERIG